LEAFNKHLEGKKFLLGDNLSIADFGFFLVSKFVEANDKNFATNFPNVHKQNHNFAELPAIKAYLSSGAPQAMFPPKFAINASF